MYKYTLLLISVLIISCTTAPSYPEFEYVGGGYDVERDFHKELQVVLDDQSIFIDSVGSIRKSITFQNSGHQGVFLVLYQGGNCGYRGHVVHDFPAGELTHEQVGGCGDWIQLDEESVFYYGLSGALTISYTSGLCGRGGSRAAWVHAPRKVFEFGEDSRSPYTLVDIDHYIEHPEALTFYQLVFDNLKSDMDMERIRYSNEYSFCTLLASEEASLEGLINEFNSIGESLPENKIEYEQGF